jgi:DNA-binding IclR family transcriptional regulator
VHDDPNELTSIRRTAIVVHHLERGEQVTVRNVVRMTGLTPSGARHLLRAISNVLPVYYDPETHTWQVVEFGELR